MDSLRILLPSAALIKIWPVEKYKMTSISFCWPCFIFDIFFNFSSQNFLAVKYFKNFSQNSDQNAIHISNRKAKFSFEFYQKTSTYFQLFWSEFVSEADGCRILQNFCSQGVLCECRLLLLAAGKQNPDSTFHQKKTSAPLIWETLHLLF